MCEGAAWQASPAPLTKAKLLGPIKARFSPFPSIPHQLSRPSLPHTLKAAAACLCPDSSHLWALRVWGLLPGQPSDEIRGTQSGASTHKQPSKATLQNPHEKAQGGGCGGGVVRGCGKGTQRS